MTRGPWSERVTTAAVWLFALWTLCSQVVVFLDGSLYALLGVFLVAGVVTFLFVRRLRRSPASRSGQAVVPPLQPPAEAERSPARLRVLRLLGALAALGTPMIYLAGSTTALWWWIAIWLLIGFASVFMSDSPALSSSPAAGRWQEVLLWAMAVAAIVFTLLVHRNDYDDSLYVNFAVAAADRPAEALLAMDTLHGIEGLPLSLPLYRLQSWELLIGAFSWLTGIPAIYGFHWVAASVAALLLPLAHARLFRLLVPRAWPWAVATSLVVLVAAGGIHRWYGNFAFVRIWQGKSLLVSILLPLVAALAMEFMARPTARRWLLLFAVQVAAVGANVTGLWAAPAVALTSLVCGMRPTFKSLRISAIGASTSLYVLAAGALSRTQTAKTIAPVEGGFDLGDRGELLQGALLETLGDGRLLLFSLVVIPLAWALAPPGLGRRFAAGMPLAVWWVLLNPYSAPLIFGLLTGPTYWRLLWSLPLPILITLVLISPLQLQGKQGRFLAAASVVAFALVVPSHSGFSRQNRVLVKRPTLKVRWPMYRLAVELDKGVPPGSQVVAPDLVSMWIPTLHRHSYPLKVRHYLDLNRFFLGEEDFEQRTAMMRYVAGAGEGNDAELFREGIEHFSVEGVCLARSEDADEARSILCRAGFVERVGDARYEIWIRESDRNECPPPLSRVFEDDFENGELRSGWSVVTEPEH